VSCQKKFRGNGSSSSPTTDLHSLWRVEGVEEVEGGEEVEGVEGGEGVEELQGVEGELNEIGSVR
jgi:hypothetical protein